MAIRLGSDPHFNQNVMKNPLYSKAYKYIEFHNYHYTLTELAEHFDTYDVSKKARKKGNKLTGEGRNSSVFLRLSRMMRDFINQHKNEVSEQQFINVVKAEGQRLNLALDNPMEQKELEYIIRSVSYWCWHIYTPKTKHTTRGRDTFINTDLDEKGRRKLSAEITNAQRANKTIAKIKKAVNTLQAKGEKITQKAVAEFTGLNKNTLLKYKDLLKK